MSTVVIMIITLILKHIGSKNFARNKKKVFELLRKKWLEFMYPSHRYANDIRSLSMYTFMEFI